MRKVKSIRQIYEEVKDHDLVITVDAPLRTALNKQLDKPMLGMFAVTPKELASEYAVHNLGKPLMDESTAILKVAKSLDLEIKQTHYNVSRIFHIWQNKGKIQQVGQYMTDSVAEMLNLVWDLPTVYSAMERFNRSVLTGKRIAVVGYDLFTELDKSVLPEVYNEIGVFTNEVYELPELYAFPSEKNVVDKVVSIIDRENADDIAIVLNPDSSYLPLVRSRLTNRGVPLNTRRQLSDHFLTRQILRLIEIGMNLNDRIVGEFLPIANLLSLHINHGYSKYLLSEYINIANKDTNLNDLYNFLTNITARSYAEVMDWLRDRDIKPPTEFMDLLEQLDIRNQVVNFDSYSNLVYYMTNFDFDIPGNKSGALLVNCMNSAYVDRPVCLFLGMDASWTRNVNEEWLDSRNENAKSLDMFQILLQQGQQRYYFVSSMKDNQKVIPCYYFNALLEPTIDNFSDPVFTIKKMGIVADTDNWEGSVSDIEAELYKFTHFSQSSLNAFVQCPKLYAYEHLSSPKEETYFLKGNLLHDFAAFYFNYPDVVNSRGNSFFVDHMIAEYRKMVSDIKIDKEYTLFNIGVQNIRSFIDALEVDYSIALDVINKSKRSEENRFANLLGMSIDSKNSEPEFIDDDLDIKGIFDLIVDHSTIVDYKSGMKKKSASKIVKGANPRFIVNKGFIDDADSEDVDRSDMQDSYSVMDDLDFQPILYIHQLRRYNTDTISFLHYYCLGNYKDIINGVADPDTSTVLIRYYPLAFNQFLQSEDAMELLASSQDRRKIISNLGTEALSSFFRQNPIPEALQFDNQQLLNSQYQDMFSQYIFDGMGKQNKSLQECADSFLKTIVSLRTGNRQKIALFFKEDLDAFELFVQEKLLEMNTYLRDGFPARPLSRKVCKKCSCSDICMNKL
ncbi:hypothetical protein GF312_13540 [Candidatus Poribacteria bacterium]|nr:hypothetical protein [Candidatus Poribacteria bacterium]